MKTIDKLSILIDIVLNLLILLHEIIIDYFLNYDSK